MNAGSHSPRPLCMLSFIIARRLTFRLEEISGDPHTVGGGFRVDVSEARTPRALEDENARLKRMLADAMLDNVALKDLLGRKW